MVRHHSETPDLPLPRLARVSSSFGVEFLSDQDVLSTTGTRVAFFARTGGVSSAPFDTLNLGANTEDDPACVEENRRRALVAVGAGRLRDRLLSPRQVHGTDVLAADDVRALPHAQAARGADGIVCTCANVPVLLCFADCVPVVMVAPGGAFCVAHAGWRGAVSSICSKALGILARRANVPASSVNVYVGPHIGACCYEVSEDLLERFCDRFGPSCDAGRRRLSLSAAVVSDLVAAGAERTRIVVEEACTCDSTDRYFSYRASGGICGRHGALACRFER